MMKRLLQALGLAFCLVASPALANNLTNPDYVVLVKPGTPNTAYDPSTGLTISTPTTIVKSGALESGHVLKATPGVLADLQVNLVTCASAPCWVMLIDATGIPSNGAVTPVRWYQASANSTIEANRFSGTPLGFAVGIVAVCSTTGPFTLTLTVQCAISAEVQ